VASVRRVRRQQCLMLRIHASMVLTGTAVGMHAARLAGWFCTLQIRTYGMVLWWVQLFTDERGRAAVRRPAHGVDPPAGSFSLARGRRIRVGRRAHGALPPGSGLWSGACVRTGPVHRDQWLSLNRLLRARESDSLFFL